VLWKQSGYAVSATLAFILFYFPTDFFVAPRVKPFDLFPMYGRVVWVEFLMKFTAKVEGLRVS
jgi:hypothetical protein